MAVMDVRYRARLGKPRTTFECALQWMWHWRVELMLLFIAICTVLSVIIEIGK